MDLTVPSAASQISYSPTGESGGNLPTTPTELQTRVKQIVDWTNAPVQEVNGVVDDTIDLVLIGVKEFIQDKVVTGSAHEITIAATGHQKGSIWFWDQTFNVDCDFTINNYAVTKSTLGTVNPIPAGTYNIMLWYTSKGVGVLIQNNTGTTPGTLATPVLVLTAINGGYSYVRSGIDPNADAEVMEYSTDNVNWLTASTTFGVNTGTVTGLTNGTLYYVRDRVSGSGYLPSGYATVTVTPSVAITQLTTPTISSVIANSSTAMTVTVNDPNTSPQESTVLFRMATNVNMVTGLVTSQQAAGTLSHQFTGLTLGNTYYFDVIHQGNGSTTSNSNSSGVVSEICMPLTTFNGTSNYLHFGDVADSVFAGASAKFAIEIDLESLVYTGSSRAIFAKYHAASNNRSFALYVLTDGRLYFSYSKNGTTTGASNYNSIYVTDIFSGGTNKKIRMEFDASAGGTYGIDKVNFYADGVLYTTGKAVTDAWVCSHIYSSAAYLSVGATVDLSGATPLSIARMVARGVKVQSWDGGAWVDEIYVPIISSGTDISGNGLNGSWV
jgi:hypothetical protein